MGRKHLKRVRAEKSKVHLKKKILSKGQNNTQTTFIVKKIITVEQLKKCDGGELSSASWIGPLKDLLVRLHHYNLTSRLSSLFGIKELLKKHPEILKGPYLKSIIEKLLELVTDVEHKVRMTALSILSVIFDLIPANSMKPFYGILTVHLGCAMTHRTSSIQLDSLRFIDLILKYSPEALKHNFNSLAQSFTRILKNYLHECHPGAFLSKRSQQDVEKIKTEILLKFYQFLCAGFYSDKQRKKEFPQTKIPDVNILVEQYMPLRRVLGQHKQIPDLLLLSKISVDNDRSLTENVLNEFQSLCLHVIPLLFDTWKEFSPVASDCMLPESTGALLSVILNILWLFYENAVALNDTQMECWFVSNFSQAFQKSFTPNFPYLCISKSCRASHFNEFAEGSGTNFLLQNLIICFLSYSFQIVKKSSSLKNKMENFLIHALMMKSQIDIDVILKVTEMIIHASRFEKSSVFMSNFMAAYNATSNVELQLGLSKILMEIVLKGSDMNYLKYHTIKQWMKTLPDRLYKPQIFVQEVQCILKLINKPIGNQILQEIEFKGKEILMNLPNIKIDGVPQLKGQKLIANILFRCSDKFIEELVKNINLTNSLCPEELKNYILEIFSYKLNVKKLKYVK